MPQRVREPVSFAAPLVVVDGAHYTEVAGHALATIAEIGGVVLLGEGAAQLLSRLDGRPVSNVLGAELDTWSGEERRRAHGVLRWCKAMGIIEDAEPGSPPHPCTWLDEPEPADSVTIAATAHADTTHADTPGQPATKPAMLILAGDADVADDAPSQMAPVTIALDDDGHPNVTTLLIPPELIEAGTTGAIAGFAGLVRATSPRTQLADPGVIDLLATIAEACDVQILDSLAPGPNPGPNPGPDPGAGR